MLVLPSVSLAGLIRGAATFLALAAAAAVLWDLLARAGASPAAWLRHRPLGSLDRWGFGFLLGLVALGTALLGVALTGLFAKPVVLAVLPALALAARAGLPSPLALAVRAAVSLPRGGIAAAAFALLPAIAWLPSPRVDQDSLAYHLGFPAQCLLAGRSPLDWVPWTFHLSLPFDLAHAIPLALGEDRLARWLLLGAFAAGCAVVAGRALGRGDRRSGWLGPLLALSAPGFFWLTTVTKNDLGAAACLVAGAILWLEEGSPAGAALLGAAVAVKITNAPLAVAWLLLARRRVVPASAGTTAVALAAALLVLPAAPWLAKSWLSTANPVYPLLWRVFPSPGWSAANNAAVDATGAWMPETFRPHGLIRAWLSSWWRDFPLPFLGLGLLLAAGRARPAGVIVLGSLTTLAFGHMARLLVPAAWLAAALTPAALSRLAGRAARTAAALAAFVALVAIWRSPSARSAPWLDACLPAGAVRAADLTTYDSAVRSLAGTAPRRLLSVGEERTYRLPARAVCNGFIGETPLVWLMVRTSADEARLERRFRQLGAGLVWYNVVSVERASYFAASFPWDDRMLRLYQTFCRRWLEVKRGPDRIDARGGGICLFGLRARPLDPPADAVWFLPGAETAIRAARLLRDGGRTREASRAFERVLAAAPRTGYFVNQLGFLRFGAGDWAGAARTLRPFVEEGMVDSVNLPSYGAAIIYLGRADEAERILLRCLSIYDTAAPNRVNLAWARQQKAVAAMNAGRLADAARDLDGAMNELAEVPTDPKAFYADARRQVAALVLGSRGDLARREGRPDEAVELYRKALELAPGIPEAKGWRRLAAAPAQ